MILYHGTSITAWENIRSSGIDSSINVDTELDFGHGFYGSFPEDIDYAVKHARKTTRNALGPFNLTNNSVIIEFEIDECLFDNPHCFDTVDDDFIDFTFDTRFHYWDERIDYDAIIGPMADGLVSIAMKLFRLFPRNVVKRFVKWNYRLPFNKHRQVAIKSQRLCDMIVIRKATNLKGDVLYEKEEDI